MTALVGLIGKKRAGKDTFAQGLILNGFTRYAFADPLKEAALALDPYVYAERDVCQNTTTYLARLSEVVSEHGWEKAKEFGEVRRTLQEFGVGIRAIDSDFWIRATLGRAIENGRAVVTDVRFPNEAEAIREAGGLLIRITRPGLVSDDQHVSETALDGFDADFNLFNECDTPGQFVNYASGFARRYGL